MIFSRSLLVISFFVLIGADHCYSNDKPYSVGSFALGERVNFSGKEYRQYDCNPSDQFESFSWCQIKKTDSEERGSYNVSYTILHARDGTIRYLNRFQEPAYWNEGEVDKDIQRVARKYGEQPRLIKGSAPGGRDTTIAIWGNVQLEPLDAESRSILATDRTVKRGILVDTIGNYTKSAREGLPLYRLTGGAGFVWIASNRKGRGILRFLAIEPSAIYSPLPEQPFTVSIPKTAPSSDQRFAQVGFWAIAPLKLEGAYGCIATAKYRDGTTFDISHLKSKSGNREWIIAVANSDWDAWISKANQHKLSLVTSKTWNGTFRVSRYKVLWAGDLNNEFIKSIADASSIEIFGDSNRPLTSISMKDSGGAISKVVDCVNETSSPEVATPKVPPSQEETFSGTAFFVESNLLLTNNHVIKECRTAVEVRSWEQPNRSTLAYVYAQDDANDLALLRTDVAGQSVASFRLRPRLGERVATYGFPYSNILSRDGNFTLGDVTASTGMRDDSRFLQVSVPIQPGNSGGPLVDMAGNVVGVMTAQLSAYAMSPQKSIPQNVNFAIGSPVVTNFLIAKGVQPKGVAPDSTRLPLTQPDVADLAKRFTVQILCRGIVQ